MRAKLEAASDALQAGVGEVVIAPGARVGVIRDLLAGKRIGTKLTSINMVSEIGMSKNG
jgi:glutamate 5-kinase